MLLMMVLMLMLPLLLMVLVLLMRHFLLPPKRVVSRTCPRWFCCRSCKSYRFPLAAFNTPFYSPLGRFRIRNVWSAALPITKMLFTRKGLREREHVHFGVGAIIEDRIQGGPPTRDRSCGVPIQCEKSPLGCARARLLADVERSLAPFDDGADDGGSGCACCARSIRLASSRPHGDAPHAVLLKALVPRTSTCLCPPGGTGTSATQGSSGVHP
jgi:hypothetical protein